MGWPVTASASSPSQLWPPPPRLPPDQSPPPTSPSPPIAAPAVSSRNIDLAIGTAELLLFVFLAFIAGREVWRQKNAKQAAANAAAVAAAAAAKEEEMQRKIFAMDKASKKVKPVDIEALNNRLKERERMRALSLQTKVPKWEVNALPTRSTDAGRHMCPSYPALAEPWSVPWSPDGGCHSAAEDGSGGEAGRPCHPLSSRASGTAPLPTRPLSSRAATARRSAAPAAEALPSPFATPSGAPLERNGQSGAVLPALELRARTPKRAVPAVLGAAAPPAPEDDLEEVRVDVDYEEADEAEADEDERGDDRERFSVLFSMLDAAFPSARSVIESAFPSARSAASSARPRNSDPGSARPSARGDSSLKCSARGEHGSREPSARQPLLGPSVHDERSDAVSHLEASAVVGSARCNASGDLPGSARAASAVPAAGCITSPVPSLACPQPRPSGQHGTTSGVAAAGHYFGDEHYAADWRDQMSPHPSQDSRLPAPAALPRPAKPQPRRTAASRAHVGSAAPIKPSPATMRLLEGGRSQQPDSRRCHPLGSLKGITSGASAAQSAPLQLGLSHPHARSAAQLQNATSVHTWGAVPWGHGDAAAKANAVDAAAAEMSKARAEHALVLEELRDARLRTPRRSDERWAKWVVRAKPITWAEEARRLAALEHEEAEEERLILLVEHERCVEGQVAEQALAPSRAPARPAVPSTPPRSLPSKSRTDAERALRRQRRARSRALAIARYGAAHELESSATDLDSGSESDSPGQPELELPDGTRRWYYLVHGGARRGPIEWPALQALKHDGVVRPDSYVFCHLLSTAWTMVFDLDLDGAEPVHDDQVEQEAEEEADPDNLLERERRRISLEQEEATAAQAEVGPTRRSRSRRRSSEDAEQEVADLMAVITSSQSASPSSQQAALQA